MIPAAPWRLKAVSAQPGWRLAVTFNDGLTGIVDLAGLVNGTDAGVFEPLRDPDFFSHVFLDYGAAAWPNGADLAPDAMHEEIRRHGIWLVTE
ncbi:MAG: DUF2442 domain-containing protein [Rhodocyclaceae bacterium]|nr:DUF2442 domain-containing protein [Rhodocyclaceae bacterium]